MFRVLQLKIKLIVFSLIITSVTLAKADVTYESKQKGVYTVTVNAAGELASALTSDPLKSASTLIIKTADGVSLNTADLDALYVADDSWAATGTKADPKTAKSLSLCDAKFAENWTNYLGGNNSDNIALLTKFTYPNTIDNVPQLAPNASATNMNLTRVCLPVRASGKYTLEPYTFIKITSLEILDILNVVDEIPHDMCANLTNLTEVNMSCAIKKVCNNAFTNCSKLKNLSLPEGLTEIESSAFNNCAITGIRLPSTLKYIGSATFQDCKYLEEIVIPENVQSIGSDAFLRCNSLKDVYVKNANTKICNDSFSPELTCRNLLVDNQKNNTAINRESYWNSSLGIGASNGASLLHIYNNGSSANQDLINEYNARYDGTRTNTIEVNGQKLNLYTLRSTDNNKFWPSSDYDQTVLESSYNYGAATGTETEREATLALPSDGLKYNGKSVSCKVDNGSVKFYYTDDNSTEQEITKSADIKIGNATTTKTENSDGSYTFTCDVTPSYPKLYFGYDQQIIIEEQITVDKDGNATTTYSYKYKGYDNAYHDADLKTNSSFILTENESRAISISAVSLTDNTYTFTYNSKSAIPDARNWGRFALAEPYSSTDEWPVSNIIDDTWYTICVPFNVTKSQIQSAFGGSTEVCEFVGVRTVTIGGKTTLDIDFTTDIMPTDAAGSTKIIEKGKAYMIHPSTHTGDYGTSGIFTITGVTADANCSPIAIPGATSDGYVSGYSFIGTFEDETLSSHVGSYFLACNTGQGEKYPQFYRATKISGTWTANTAIVTPPAGGSGSAKSMTIYLGSEGLDFDHMIIEGDANSTDINEIRANSIVTVNADNRVYNMQGVYVGNSLDGLNSGIYIANGKKYVVR